MYYLYTKTGYNLVSFILKPLTPPPPFHYPGVRLNFCARSSDLSHTHTTKIGSVAKKTRNSDAVRILV